MRRVDRSWRRRGVANAGRLHQCHTALHAPREGWQHILLDRHFRGHHARRWLCELLHAFTAPRLPRCRCPCWGRDAPGWHALWPTVIQIQAVCDAHWNVQKLPSQLLVLLCEPPVLASQALKRNGISRHRTAWMPKPGLRATDYRPSRGLTDAKFSSKVARLCNRYLTLHPPKGPQPYICYSLGIPTQL